MRKFLIVTVIVLTACFVNGQGYDTINNIIEIRTEDDLKNCDTNHLFNVVKLFEEKRLLVNIEKLEKLHFKKFFYQGKRSCFPRYTKKVVELSAIEMLGKNVVKIPDFVSLANLTFVFIESSKFKFDEGFLDAKKLSSLHLFMDNTTETAKIICKIQSLEELSYYTRKPLNLDTAHCFFNLPRLTYIELNASSKDMKQLRFIRGLKEISLLNKVSFEDIENNKYWLQHLDQIHISTSRVSNKDYERMKKLLPNLR